MTVSDTQVNQSSLDEFDLSQILVFGFLIRVKVEFPLSLAE
jgi:hypothetical protein